MSGSMGIFFLRCQERESNNLSSRVAFGNLLLTIATQPSTPATSILTHLSAQARCGTPRVQPREEPRLQLDHARPPLASNHAPFLAGFPKESSLKYLGAGGWGREVKHSESALGVVLG